MDILVLNSQNRSYGIPMSVVIGTHLLKDFTYYEIPSMPQNMLGIGQYMGQVIPIFDLHAIVSKTDLESLPSKLIMVQFEDSVFGLCVHDIQGIFNYKEHIFPSVYTYVDLKALRRTL